jgi:hypothetical protein
MIVACTGVFPLQRHFLLCTLFEAGSYSRSVSGRQLIDKFLLDQSRATLAQLDLDDTDIELQCNERYVTLIFIFAIFV